MTRCWEGRWARSGRWRRRRSSRRSRGRRRGRGGPCGGRRTAVPPAAGRRPRPSRCRRRRRRTPCSGRRRPDRPAGRTRRRRPGWPSGNPAGQCQVVLAGGAARDAQCRATRDEEQAVHGDRGALRPEDLRRGGRETTLPEVPAAGGPAARPVPAQAGEVVLAAVADEHAGAAAAQRGRSMPARSPISPTRFSATAAAAGPCRWPRGGGGG